MVPVSPSLRSVWLRSAPLAALSPASLRDAFRSADAPVHDQTFPLDRALVTQEPAEPLCARCDAVCCRLTVVVQPEDRIPAHLTTVTDAGLEVMARDEEGWCVAVDAAHMRCSIYDSRPDVCRRFVMAGPYCLDLRADYNDRTTRRIPLRLY